ncbi:hypothetical protein ACFL1B_06275 [Nanoarchaeota archaeon]
MPFRNYVVQTIGKKDALVLEDRLHQHMHTEGIMNKAGELTAAAFDRELAPGEDIAVNIEAGEEHSVALYGLIKEKDFEILHKGIESIRLFSRQYLLWGPQLPTHETNLLVQGSELSLVALHDSLVTDPNYFVMRAGNVTKMHWTANSGYRNSPRVMDAYLREARGFVASTSGLKFEGQVKFTAPNAHWVNMVVSGDIESVLQARAQLISGVQSIGIRDESSQYVK